jgi:hypothetical protein
MLSDRRGFLVAASAAAMSILFRAKAYRPTVGPRLNIVLVDDADPISADIKRGVTMGVDEAARSAQLFGGSARLVDSTHDATDALAVFIGGASVTRATAIGDDAASTGSLYFNVAVGDETLRERCVREVFHFAPVDARDGAVAWSPKLFRFGADTLNKRYRDRYQRDMTPVAWTSWFAVKVAWEASLEGKATNPKQLLDVLERPSTRFDGHKGEPLYFDANHQLVQPLYAADGAPVSATPSTTRMCKWKG